MIIDILIVLLTIVAVVFGYRRGFVVQLCSLIALYMGVLLAPQLASPIGAFITDDPGLGYILGFVILVVVALIIVRLIAPLLRKILIWDFIRKIDSILGAIFAFFTTILVLAVFCSVFDTANIGEMKPEMVLELGSTEMTEEQRADLITKLENKDPEVRGCFESKYIDYEVLDDSALFNALGDFGDSICPGLEEFKDAMVDWAVSMAVSENGGAGE